LAHPLSAIRAGVGVAAARPHFHDRGILLVAVIPVSEIMAVRP
jgi:hypothetical protein